MKINHLTVLPNHATEDAVYIFTRRHIISFLTSIIWALLFWFVPLVFYIIYIYKAQDFATSEKQIVILALLPYYLLLTTYIFVEWISYYYNILIVTQTTLTDIIQRSVFSRETLYIHLQQMEDISSRINGLLPTIFNYGDIFIQTAGSEVHTIIHNIPNPHHAASMIAKLHRNLLDEGGVRVAEKSDILNKR